MQQQGYVTEPLPKFLEVAAFTAARQQETLALADALKSSDDGKKFGIQANPRQLRRRTGAYNTFKHNLRPNVKKNAKRRRLEDSPTVAGQEEAQEQDNECTPKLESRAMRRRRGRLQATFEASAANSISGQGLRRLETHVWHAKRMQMKQRWGHVLAEGLVGRGHGSRSLLHKLQQGTIMHDASYWCPLQLSGQVEDLLSIIASCSGPAAVQSLRLDEAFWAGSKEHQVMLHHTGSFPTRAISPMTMLMAPLASAAAEEMTGFGQVERQLLVFIHAAAAMEGEATLRAASRLQGVTLKVRTFDLRRIELRGMGADAALAAVLNLPRYDQLSGSADEHSWRELTRKDQVGKGFERLQDGSALSIRIRDPRLARPMQIAGQEDLHAGQAGHYALPVSDPATSSLQGTQTPMLQRVADGRPPPISGIWSPGAAPSAISEKLVSCMRRQARKDALHLCFPPQAGTEAAQEQQDPLCPLVAVRRSGLPSSPTSWSLILPRGWVCPLWHALAFTGATPAGQREWRWVAQQHGAGFFPHDFPDTRAAAEMTATLTAEDNTLRQLRPKGRYPDATAPDWSILGTACERVMITDEGEKPAALCSPDAQGCSAQAQAWPDRSAPTRNSMELSGKMELQDALPGDDLKPAFLRLTSPCPGIGRDEHGGGNLCSVSGATVPDSLGQQERAALGPHHFQQPAAAYNEAIAPHLASHGGWESSGSAMQPVCLTLKVHPISGVCAVGLHLRNADELDVGTLSLPASLRPQSEDVSCLLAEGCYVARSLHTLRAGLTGSPLRAVSAPQSRGHVMWQPRRAHRSAVGAFRDADPKCMVRVRLQVLGKGTVEDDAAILAPRQPGLGPGQEAVIGFCTCSAPRGLSGKRGASAVCSAKALWQLAAARPAQLPTNGKLGPVRVLVKNLRSTVLRPATAICWVEVPEGDRLT